MIAALLSPEVREATVLEVYFSRSLGFGLLTIGILTVMLTGSVPLSSRLTEGLTTSGATTDPADPKAPYALPTLTATALYHSACAFYSYTLYLQDGVASFLIQTAVSTIFAAVGLWCILFASNSDGRISRKTGADKRTSGFPFKNAEADKRKDKKGL
jgi:ribose/xylose/arabinose/galactoside ABC-type transport system permease subunit